MQDKIQTIPEIESKDSSASTPYHLDCTFFEHKNSRIRPKKPDEFQSIDFSTLVPKNFRVELPKKAGNTENAAAKGNEIAMFFISVGNLPKAADELGGTQMKIHTTENRRVLH